MLCASIGRAGHGLKRQTLSLPYSRRYATAITDLSHFPKAGDKLHGFTAQRAKYIPELELSAIHLTHDKTGADYMHIARDDKNNVFSIGFKTNPPDATGVPHILEHTTLCGSEKYPVRDPFFKMLNRSLSNFMNAFTSSDHTTYPFATTNAIDYQNLMDVYLDATLKPLLKESDFSQEGWRVGPENPAEESSPLVFKGVVYNEMKGQYSDASYLFYMRFQDHIFPSVNNSGGDPAKIPDLTIEQLRDFHHQHYHPSNAKIFSYGNLPLEGSLERVNEKLSLFERINIDKDLKEPITITEPIRIRVPGPLDPLADKDQQHRTSISWIMNNTTDVHETFGLRVLSTLLMDGYGSPSYKSLIDSKLGADYSPNTGYDTSSKKGIFTVGLQNVAEADIPKAEEAVRELLKKVHSEGFDPIKVEGVLHQLEISLKHKAAGFGMSLMQRLKPSWFNGVDPFDALAWDDVVTTFKQNYAKGGYLEELMEKYLLNDRTLAFTMYPSKDYDANLAKEEASRLLVEIAKAGPEVESRKTFEESEKVLVQIQEEAKHQDLSCLPTVHVRDIPRQMERKEISEEVLGRDIHVQWRNAPTNGLTYFRALNVFDDIPDELRAYLPLYTEAIFRLGTPTMTIERIEDEIKLKTGGLRASHFVTTNHSNLDLRREGLAFTGHCLDKNVPDMFELLRMLLVETSFDRVSKIRTLVHGMASGAINQIAESGHSYAKGFASAHLTSAARASETTGGMTQVKMISDMAQSENYYPAINAMKDIAEFAASKLSLRTAITCGTEAVADNTKALEKFVGTMNHGKAPLSEAPPFQPILTSKSFFPFPFQVNYTASALRTVPYTHPDGAPLQVLANLLSHKHLHHEIREKGGAYGGGAFSGGTAGIFGFYSYRDPNPLNTLKTYKGSGDFAVARQWTDRDLEEAKLSIFQSVDAPTSVSREGMTYFLEGITDDMRQTRREQLLDVTAAQVQDVAQRHLVEQLKSDQAATVVLGEKKDWATGETGWGVYNLMPEETVQEVMAPKVRL